MSNVVHVSLLTEVASRFRGLAPWCSVAEPHYLHPSSQSSPWTESRRSRRSLNILFSPSCRGLWCVNRINSLAPGCADLLAACGLEGAHWSSEDGALGAGEWGGSGPRSCPCGAPPRRVGREVTASGAAPQKPVRTAATVRATSGSLPSASAFSLPRFPSSHRAPATRPQPALSSAPRSHRARPEPSHGGPARPGAPLHRFAHPAQRWPGLLQGGRAALRPEPHHQAAHRLLLQGGGQD